MQCPKCGNDSPDDAQACGSCSLILTKPDQERHGPSKGNWLLPVIGALLMGLAAGLVVFLKPTWAFFAALLACFSMISDIRRNWNKRKIMGKAIGVVILIVVCLHMVMLSYLSIDAAPISDDYTISDIRSASAQYNHTYPLLKSLVQDEYGSGAPALGLSADDVRRIIEMYDIFEQDDLEAIAAQLLAHEQEILSIWQHAEKGRDVLAKLGSFPEIADLQEPGFEIDEPWMRGTRRMILLYRIYICLQSCRGNHETALAELMRLDSIGRKMSLTARSTIVKLQCFTCLLADAWTANLIINNPDTPNEVLLALERHMAPFSDEHISLRNQMIFEYLVCRHELEKMSREPRLRYSPFRPLKLDSTLRLLRNFFDELVAIEEGRTETKKLRVWPALYPNLPVQNGRGNWQPWCYRIYNPVGDALFGMTAGSFNNVFRLRTKLQIRSELLKIVLDKRLGKEVSLKARAYSDEYIVDVESKKILSPGPDGKGGTKDDIKLPINPEVLRFDSLRR